ncbi:protein kinase [Nonomuraea sp. NPDC050643]|uniref:protein kinase domain-containing protein n=1 Tax=Nonomuraea sp. NPDC050643 TaxID=3155660 RepID=UPI0034119AED
MPNVEPLRQGDPPTVGAYRLMGRLGQGGQGVVYLGQAGDGRPVAVKVLRTRDERLAKEIDAARRVQPFCIAQVLDASLEGVPYIVTEYVHGPSLQEAGRHQGADLQRLAVATATALAAIHQAGVVHRDFKPGNVLLGPDGPRVIDFGIARAMDQARTTTSSIVGTPAYMAPEQLAGELVGPAADVFAWASVIAFAATGSPPFGEDSLPAVINRILHNEPQLADLPQPLRGIALRCLAKNPADRPTMQDVMLRLLGGGTAAYVASGPVTGSRRRQPAPGRRKAVMAVAGAVAVATTAAIATTATLAMSSDDPGTTPSAVAQPVTTEPGTGKPSTTKSATKKPATQRPTGKPTTRRPAEQPTARRSADRPGTQRPTSRPTVKTTPKPAARPNIRILSVEAMGNRHPPSDCLYGATLIKAMVEGPPGIDFTYSWVLDGKVVGTSQWATRDSATQLPQYGPIMELGTHRVVLRITSPISVQRGVAFENCDDDN